MQRRVVSALVALALGLAITACGGGSQSLSTGEFRTQANAVCRDITRRLDTINAETTRATMSAGLMRAADAMGTAVEQLEAIDPPPALASRFDEYKAWARTRQAAAAKLAHPGRALSARQEQAVRPHANGGSTVARQLHLEECS